VLIFFSSFFFVCVFPESYEENSEEEGASEEEEEEDEESLIKEVRKKRSVKGGIRESKKSTQRAVKEVQGRKRLRQLADSSSNDDDDDLHRLPATQVPIDQVARKAKAVRALLSSSEENADTSAGDFSSPVGPKLRKLDSDDSGTGHQRRDIASDVKESVSDASLSRLSEGDNEHGASKQKAAVRELHEKLNTDEGLKKTNPDKTKSSQGFRVPLSERLGAAANDFCGTGTANLVKTSSRSKRGYESFQATSSTYNCSDVTSRSPPVCETVSSHIMKGRSTSPTRLSDAKSSHVTQGQTVTANHEDKRRRGENSSVGSRPSEESETATKFTGIVRPVSFVFFFLSSSSSSSS
jgi:hypothetical protein